jgi:integral membrane protein
VKPGVLTFYRIMAYVSAVLLILLCAAVVLKYGHFVGLWPKGSVTQLFGETWTFRIGVVHGWLYMVYLLVAVVATTQLRAPIGRMLLVLLAGTIPFGAFVAERKVVHWHELRLAGKPIVPPHSSVNSEESRA